MTPNRPISLMLRYWGDISYTNDIYNYIVILQTTTLQYCVVLQRQYYNYIVTLDQY